MREASFFAHQLIWLGSVSATLLGTQSASAQEPLAAPDEPVAKTISEEAVEATTATEAAPVALSPETEATPVPDATASSPDAEAKHASPQLRAELESLRAEIEEMKLKQEEAEMAALFVEEPVEVEGPTFQVYGFMDMGLQRNWVNKKSVVASLFETNSLTFVTGNIDLYFDFNPDPDWRALAEIRFTGAPHGQIENFGGVAGDFKRTNTNQYDPNGTVVNAPVWGGYSVIERAWIEWGRYQQLRLRVGHFFTPFGIWNVDHGQPTLISLALPQFIQQGFLPLRQTGMQALGNFFAGNWEVAYRAWLSNGRTEENWLDYSDNKAFGGRLFIRNDDGKFRTQLGASYHHGKVENKVVDITGVPPFTENVEFHAYSTIAYREDIVGVDLSIDIVDTRFRAEYVGQLRQWDEGMRSHNGIEVNVPNSYDPDGWRQSAYLLVAQQLPWWGLEPYLFGEVLRQDWALAGDALVMASLGLNVHFTPAAMLKNQVTMSRFFKWKQPDDFPGDPGFNNAESLISRLVLAF